VLSDDNKDTISVGDTEERPAVLRLCLSPGCAIGARVDLAHVKTFGSHNPGSVSKDDVSDGCIRRRYGALCPGAPIGSGPDCCIHAPGDNFTIACSHSLHVREEAAQGMLCPRGAI